MARTFDPIELELLWRRLISMVDEAAAAMVRTSFSTLVRESYDFSCVITDASGQSLVQASESIPSFIGTLPETVKDRKSTRLNSSHAITSRMPSSA